jgi:hypothetical protein
MAWSLDIVEFQQFMIQIHEDDLKLVVPQQSIRRIFWGKQLGSKMSRITNNEIDWITSIP